LGRHVLSSSNQGTGLFALANPAYAGVASPLRDCRPHLAKGGCPHGSPGSDHGLSLLGFTCRSSIYDKATSRPPETLFGMNFADGSRFARMGRRSGETQGVKSASVVPACPIRATSGLSGEFLLTLCTRRITGQCVSAQPTRQVFASQHIVLSRKWSVSARASTHSLLIAGVVIAVVVPDDHARPATDAGAHPAQTC